MDLLKKFLKDKATLKWGFFKKAIRTLKTWIFKVFFWKTKGTYNMDFLNIFLKNEVQRKHGFFEVFSEGQRNPKPWNP